MTRQELKRLNRAELLELLLEQTVESERLRAELTAAQQKLADKEILLEDAGNIAEATLRLNGVFEAAQAACDQYIENIQLMRERQERMCVRRELETRIRLEELLRTVMADQYAGVGESEPQFYGGMSRMQCAGVAVGGEEG